MEVPVGYVVLRPGATAAATATVTATATATATATEEWIIAACKEEIASFKIPRRVVVVGELPQTATRKVQRALIRQAALEGGLQLKPGTQ